MIIDDKSLAVERGINMFCKTLKMLREANHLTRSEMAKKLNITSQAYANYENGNRKPNMDMIIKLADFFNVSTDFLLGRSNKLKEKEEENVYLINTEGLSEDEIQDIEKMVEFMRYKANLNKK